MSEFDARYSHSVKKLPPEQVDISTARLPLFWLAIAYTVFVIYGSLVPLNFQYHDMQWALDSFKNIQYLNLGIGSRADWVANILLFIPLAFLWLGVFWTSKNSAWRIPATFLVLILSIGLCISIEFTQQFFPPRTVSLNDIYAEIIGIFLGLILWHATGHRIVQLSRSAFQGGEQARIAALIVYSLTYLVLCLFPYDFLLSLNEFQTHLVSTKTGGLFTGNCDSRCFLKLIPEALSISPMGILGALTLWKFRRAPLLLAAITGLLVGVLIEGLQLTIASGLSQGASIFAKALGIVFGAWMTLFLQKIDLSLVQRILRPLILLGSLPFLVLLAMLNHWFTQSWMAIPLGLDRLHELHFMPFYYHYYTSEAVAMVSLLYQAALYWPIGAAVWLWDWSGHIGKPRVNRYLWITVFTGLLAGLVETGKLFISSQHPDPTNILIAIVAANAIFLLMGLLLTNESRQILPSTFSTDPSDGFEKARQTLQPSTVAQIHQQSELVQTNKTETTDNESIEFPSTPKSSLSTWLLGVPAICLALFAAATSPLGALWVLPLLLVYSVMLWYRPNYWLIWVLALLPILDFTTITGRLFWTEYDTLLLITIGISYLRTYTELPTFALLRPSTKPFLALFSISAATSLIIGLLPLSAIDINSFSSYISSYNALRAAKGFMFALLVFPLLAKEWLNRENAVRKLALGMTLGLTIEVLYVLWERVTFSGLFNFESGYRITGSFPAMHIGGAYIEGYLVIALPFVALWAWLQHNKLLSLLAFGLYGLGAYSVMVTFSRGGQAAFVLETFILILGFISLLLRERSRKLIRVSIVFLMALIVVSLIWPILSAKYSQSRIATTGQDVNIRTSHWQDALQIFNAKNSRILGVGLGTFPSAYFWGSSELTRPSTYVFSTQNKNTYLQLGSGESLYFEQPVAVKPDQEYLLSLDLRSSSGIAELTVPVCEKGILYSFNCSWNTLRNKNNSGTWEHQEIKIRSAGFGPPGSRFPRPVKLSIFNGRSNTLVDVDNVELIDSIGINLLQNGDFSLGMQHWGFSTDSHLAWHIKNLYIHILFEQGWFGLSCFLVLIVSALMRWLKGCFNYDPVSLVLFSAVLAFLVVGFIDSLIDETRLGFLFYLLLFTGLFAEKPVTLNSTSNKRIRKRRSRT